MEHIGIIDSSLVFSRLMQKDVLVLISWANSQFFSNPNILYPHHSLITVFSISCKEKTCPNFSLYRSMPRTRIRCCAFTPNLYIVPLQHNTASLLCQDVKSLSIFTFTYMKMSSGLKLSCFSHPVPHKT